MNRRNIGVGGVAGASSVTRGLQQAAGAAAVTAIAASFRGITVVSAASDAVETAELFDRTHADRSLSPIDQYIENTNALNRLYLGLDPMPSELGSLVLLGYVSAVESFFRALFRGLINIDDVSGRLAEPLAVPYGAALHLNKKMLPEAVIEEYSFASVANVKEAIRALGGIKGHIPVEVEAALREFQKVCEMRHCCVHRFGKLGAKNAIKLGLERHREILEKPLKLDRDALEQIGQALRGFVKIINNFVFSSLMERSVLNRGDGHLDAPYSTEWSWVWGADKSRFVKYYFLFASNLDAVPSPPARSIYDSVRLFAEEGRVRSGRRSAGRSPAVNIAP